MGVFSPAAHERLLPPERGGADGIGRIEAPDETPEPTKTCPFKVGDIVKLKSGGPDMTVDCVPTRRRDLPPEFIDVSWFVPGGTLEEASFQPAALREVGK